MTIIIIIIIIIIIKLKIKNEFVRTRSVKEKVILTFEITMYGKGNMHK